VDEPVGDLPGFALGLFLFEGVDQLDPGEEADPLSMMLIACTPSAVATWVFPVPGPPTNTILSATSIKSQRCSCRTSASLTSLLAKSKPARSR
jgi:hypothetical protein